MPQVETRLDLARHLQGQMAASRVPWVTEEDETSEKTMLKTYLLEAHEPDKANRIQALEAIGRQLDFSVHPTSDPDLVRLATGDSEFWCDASLGRYWRLHTSTKVDKADEFRARLVNATRWVDNVWFPLGYLETFPSQVDAKMLSFSVSHDRRKLNRAGVVHSDADFVSLQLFASNAASTLQRLHEVDVFPNGVSVRGVRLRAGSDEPDEEYCVAAYYFDGKVTASGSSFDEHNRLLLKALEDYSGFIHRIEHKYAIGTDPGAAHVGIQGDPIGIEVKWEVADLDYAIDRMFRGGEPFRLWGLPERLGQDRYRVRATDLHFGGVLGFDISPTQMTVQLPRGVCGNTIARLLSNLRIHVSSQASMPDEPTRARTSAA